MHRALGVARGHEPPSGLDATAAISLREGADEPEQRRACCRSAASRSPRVSRRSSRLTPGHGEQQRAVEAGLGQRLRAEPLGVGRQRLVARVVALDERHDPGDHRRTSRTPAPTSSAAQAAVRPALALGVPLAGGAALVEERPLGGVQVRAVPVRPLERGGEPGAAVEVRGLPAAARPTAGRRCPAGGAGAGPRGPRRASGAAWATRGSAPRGRPRRCPRRGSRGERPRAARAATRHRVRRGALRDELLDRARAVGVSSIPSPSSVSRRKRLRTSARRSSGSDSTSVSAVRATRRRDAAALPVALDRQRAPVAPLPGRAQRVREERERARLAGDVAQRRGRPARARAAAPRGAPARLPPGAAPSSVIAPSRIWFAGDRAGEPGVGAQLRRRGRRAPRSPPGRGARAARR